MQEAIWKKVSLTFTPVLALASKNPMLNSLANSYPYCVSMTFLPSKSHLFPTRIFSTF